MVSISNGQVLDSQGQSPWRWSLVTDSFWGIAEFWFCFSRLLQQEVKKRRGYGHPSASRHAEESQQESLPEEWASSSPNGWWMRKVTVCSKKQTTEQTHSWQRADHAGLTVYASTRTALCPHRWVRARWEFPTQGSGVADVQLHTCTYVCPYLLCIVCKSINIVLIRKYF